MSQSIEEITKKIGETGEAFDVAVADAETVLKQLNAALSPYRARLPQKLRGVVDAINDMEAAK